MPGPWSPGSLESVRTAYRRNHLLGKAGLKHHNGSLKCIGEDRQILAFGQTDTGRHVCILHRVTKVTACKPPVTGTTRARAQSGKRGNARQDTNSLQRVITVDLLYHDEFRPKPCNHQSSTKPVRLSRSAIPVFWHAHSTKYHANSTSACNWTTLTSRLTACGLRHCKSPVSIDMVLTDHAPDPLAPTASCCNEECHTDFVAIYAPTF